MEFPRIAFGAGNGEHQVGEMGPVLTAYLPLHTTYFIPRATTTSMVFMPYGLDREKVLCLYFDCWVSVFCMHVSILVHILLVSYSNDIKESPVQQDKTVG